MQSITGDDMRLPRSVQDIADVIGTEQALFLVGQMPRFKNASRGNSQPVMYVPTRTRLNPKHELVRILGWNDAVALVGAFGGEILQPANCAEIYRAFRDRSIVQMHGEGMKPAAIAELMAVSDRHVRNLVREKPQVDAPAANDNTPQPIKHQHREVCAQ